MLIFFTNQSIRSTNFEGTAIENFLKWIDATPAVWPVVVLILLPGLFVTFVFGWMLIIARGKDSSQISVSAFGVDIQFEASRSGVDRRKQKETNEQG